MTHRVCLVHYHEIGLKGKNRSTFENQLVRNLNRALRGQGVDAVKRVSGHILVSFASGQATEDHARIIAQVPGVARVSLAYLCHLDETEYCAAAVKALGEAGDFETFKVHARRSATAYGLHTLDIHQLVGGVLCEAFPTKKVQMRNPDGTVFVLENGRTGRRELREAVAQMTRSGTPVLGCVLNKVSAGRLGSGRYYHRYGYGRGYYARRPGTRKGE